MRRSSAAVLIWLPWLLVLGADRAQAQEAARGRQIAAAVLPLPAELRSGAEVVTVDNRGRPQVLRAGDNGLVCLADPPGDSTFDVRCYQAAFVPLIYRLRQLAAQGVADSALNRTIDADIRSGRLGITREPTAGYRMYGPVAGYDSTRNAVSDGIDAWQSVHLPYRTAASIGLPTREDGIHPYVMASGTFWAHVMIMQRPLRY
jgi:hypothetical protein